MGFCVKCGNKLNGNTKFCPKCGFEVKNVNLENTNKNDRLNILKQLYIGNFKKIKQKY